MLQSTTQGSQASLW